MSTEFFLLCRARGFQLRPFQLQQGATVVGRSTKCDFVLRDDSVSRQHAEILIEGDVAKIRDLGSSNGTFLGEQQIRESPLTSGLEIRFGRIPFFFCDANDQDLVDDSDVETIRLSNTKSDLKEPANTIAIEFNLTPQQRRVLKLLLDGLTLSEVAELLKISRETVASHTKKIYQICSVNSRAQLFALFLGR